LNKNVFTHTNDELRDRPGRHSLGDQEVKQALLPAASGTARTTEAHADRGGRADRPAAAASPHREAAGGAHGGALLQAPAHRKAPAPQAALPPH